MQSNFFGKPGLKLLRKDGSTVPAVDALKEADFVLVYFSAHWCPPCREFTPQLKQFYDAHHEKKKFEVVFMSLDNSEKEMLDYFKEAHADYYCMQYEDTKAMSWDWGKKYAFKSIPTLLLFENSSPRKLVAKCGRAMVLEDPNAETFPWRDADATHPAQASIMEYVHKAAKAPCPLPDGQQSWAPLESSSTQWELRSFLAVLSEDPSIEERCQVWAANLILTFVVAAVVMLRIWWTCGNLPPSDSNYEPALGRVIHTGEPRDVDLPVGEERSTPFSVASFLQPTTLSSRWFRELARGAPRKSHASVPSLVSRSTSCSVPSCCYPCLSMYLPASTAQPAAAASSDSSLSRAVNSRCNDVDALLPNAEESLDSQTRWERWWHVVSCRSIWSCFLDRQRVVHSRMRALFHSCAEAWEVLWKPFSVFPSLSLPHHSNGARSLIQPCRSSTQHHRPHAAEDKWTRELLDLSDEEQEGFVAEQEALWGLLEGIERRRRALTGRSLFRQPLPSHRQRRLGGALCFPASCSLSPATAPDQGMAERQLRSQTTDAASPAVAVIIPTLAVGVPLEFSTDRKARPVLADRQGRWIPVAVIDEEVEYYNYNLDQVLPLA